MVGAPNANTLFYGDNLDILRQHVADESVDLVYLDPPFNSNATYNVLFRSPTGEQSAAQIEAFDDTWHWNLAAEKAFDEVVQSGNSDAASVIIAIRSFLGENDMMAYLAMMAVRLIELHRVLKISGSLYLHCDPTASHYLKILLDAIFGPDRFTGEIVWKRYGAHNDSKTYGRIHDIILYYNKSNTFTFNKQYEAYSEEYVKERFRFTDPDGRRWAEQNLASPNPRPNLTYPFKARNGIIYDPPPNGWKYTADRMRELDDNNGLHYPAREGGRLRLKNYFDERAGVPVQDVWTDLTSIGGTSPERLGYPTQKPVALLERLLAASSNEEDVVLDPFCGCGTTIHAAQKLKRRWLGIDVTHLAIGLIQRRLTDAFPMVQYEVVGVPKDVSSASALALADKYEFQKWALSMVEAQPYKGGKKGADGGVDGYIYFKPDGKKTEKAIVSVKGGNHVSDTMIKDLITTVDHEGAKIGVFITLSPATKPMISRAATAGFYKPDSEFSKLSGATYPKIQILTIEDLFNGKKPHMPWIDATAFKKAKVEQGAKAQGTLDL